MHNVLVLDRLFSKQICLKKKALLNTIIIVPLAIFYKLSSPSMLYLLKEKIR